MIRLAACLVVMGGLVLPAPTRELIVPGSLLPYARSFETQATVRDPEFSMGRMTITFVEELDAEVGDACYLHQFEYVGECSYLYREVHLARPWWLSASEDKRQNLMFHELGHCALLQDHRSDQRGDAPASIMTPRVMQAGQYNESSRYRYMEELFTFHIKDLQK